MIQELSFCSECGGLRGCKDADGSVRHCYWRCEKRRGCEVFVVFNNINQLNAKSKEVYKITLKICSKCRNNMRRT